MIVSALPDDLRLIGRDFSVVADPARPHRIKPWRQKRAKKLVRSALFGDLLRTRTEAIPTKMPTVGFTASAPLYGRPNAALGPPFGLPTCASCARLTTGIYTAR